LFVLTGFQALRASPEIQWMGCSARRKPQQYTNIARICNAAMRPAIEFLEKPE
jgi:hypothetical protein